jgi:hypothetical protein
MAELYSGTGVTKTGDLKSKKSFGEIILRSTATILELTNEKMNFEVEQANGNNKKIAKSIPLIDIVLAAIQGEGVVTSDATYPLICKIELAKNGYIPLADGEQLIISLEGLKPLETYVLNGIEEPEASDDVVCYEMKTMAADEKSRKYGVGGFDMVVLNLPASVKDITYTTENGRTVKYLPEELRALVADIDPVIAYNNDGTILQAHPLKLVLPLVAIAEIEINKDAGDIIEMTLVDVQHYNR